MPSADPRRSLQLLEPTTDSLNGAIGALTQEQWQQASSCAGWHVADLVAHVVRNGWSFLTFVQRALAGNLDPPFGPAVTAIEDEVRAAGPRAAAERQQRETEEFIALTQSLSDEDLQTKQGGHRAGPRSVAWACTQRLVEVAFHQWDLRHSLGHDEPLAGDLAAHLLPFMLDPRGANIMTRGPSLEPATSFRLNSTTDGSVWRVTVGPKGRQVDADPGQPAEVEVRAEPGWLALALYGRLSAESSHLNVSGLDDGRQRFQAAFGA